MNMQDNEFDGLFRNKLNGFESEPSERVWRDIDAELGDKKRAILPWLSIAASIIVLASAGILFIPKGHKVTHSGEVLLTHKPKPAIITPAEQAVVSTKPIKNDEPVNQDQKVNTERYKKQNIATPALVKPEETIVKNEPVKPVKQPELIAQVTQKTDQAKQSVVPDLGTPLAINHNTNADSAMSTAKPNLITTVQPEVKTVTPAVKKHGIRSFGDLVNLVVAKVDKRKDKAVQFTDDEDGDGSTLTAVNIGPLKIGKDDKEDR